MAISLSAPRATELKPRIVVFGVGGAGGNAVNNMIDAGLEGVEFVVANTDAQQLQFSRTDLRIQLGAGVTQGLGAGAHPEVGMSAAEESALEIAEHLDGAHMVFITAGMGGGTGTGAAPVIAKCARERGILTVGVVTKPFMFEGRHRMRLADAGIAELQRYVDTLIIIPNQNLFRIANERTTFAEAFGMADQVLHAGVRSITDLMVLPGLINLDFADVRSVMSDMGKAMMGTGEASGEDRASLAAQNAIQNPLLDETSLKGARAVLINVTGGNDMTLHEIDEAANVISSEVDPDANIIFGAAFDPALDGKLRVSVVATGMDNASATMNPPVSASTFTPAPRPASFGGSGGSGLGAFGRPAPQVAQPAPQYSTQYTAQPAVQVAPEPVIAETVAQAAAPQPAPVQVAPAAPRSSLFSEPRQAPAEFRAAAPEPVILTAEPSAYADEPELADFASEPVERATGIGLQGLDSAGPAAVAPPSRATSPVISRPTSYIAAEDTASAVRAAAPLPAAPSSPPQAAHAPVTATQPSAAQMSATQAPRMSVHEEEGRDSFWRGLFPQRGRGVAAQTPVQPQPQVQAPVQQPAAPQARRDPVAEADMAADRYAGSARPAQQPAARGVAQPSMEGEEDLEIPAFLRRLAN